MKSTPRLKMYNPTWIVRQINARPQLLRNEVGRCTAERAGESTGTEENGWDLMVGRAHGLGEMM